MKGLSHNAMADRPNAVRLHVPDMPELPRTLRQMLAKERSAVLESLATCDVGVFQKRQGMIEGFTAAIGMCEQLEKRISGE